jgi:hypothetical protein
MPGTVQGPEVSRPMSKCTPQCLRQKLRHTPLFNRSATVDLPDFTRLERRAGPFLY